MDYILKQILEEQTHEQKIQKEKELLNHQLDAILRKVTKEHCIAITDDEDSLTTACLLQMLIKRKKGYHIPIRAFYSFKSVVIDGHHTISYDNDVIPDDRIIACDLSLLRGFTRTPDKNRDWFSPHGQLFTIDNHVNKFNDDELDDTTSDIFSLNMNSRVTRRSYSDKSATSSAYTLLCATDHTLLLDDNKREYTPFEQLAFLLIDGMHHATNGNYKGYKERWQYVWEVDKYFTNEKVRQLTNEQFNEIQLKLGLKKYNNEGKREKTVKVNKDGKLIIDDNTLNFLSRFEWISDDFIQEIKDLQFKTYIPFKSFTHKIIKNERGNYEKCNLETIEKKYGEVINLAILDKSTVVGAVVDENSFPRKYETSCKR